MKKGIQFLGLIASTAMLTIACTKDDDNPTPTTIDTTNNGTYKIFTINTTTTVQNLTADTIIGIAGNGQPFGTGKFTFFSLENKAIVPNSDSGSSKWDIAFRGTTILVNSGTSGPANGGAYVQLGNFDDLKTIPSDSVFKTDASPLYAIRSGSNNGWYNYNAPANLVTPLPGRILVIRTASGKYAKMEITNYYKAGTTPASTASDEDKLNKQRYFTFRYQYQPNGSNQFN